MLHAGRAFVYVYDARPCRRVKITLASWQQRDIMKQIVRLVIPAAPAPAQSSNTQAAQRSINQQGIRLGVLDNSKGNADHLLKMIVEGVRAQISLAAVTYARKPYVSMAAPPETLDQLAREADVVISAMAD